MDVSNQTGNYLCDRHKVHDGKLYCASDARFSVTVTRNKSGFPGLGTSVTYAACSHHLAAIVRKCSEKDVNGATTVHVLP